MSKGAEKDVVRTRFRRGDGPWVYVNVVMPDYFDILNVANRHFGDPTRYIGGPKLKKKERR